MTEHPESSNVLGEALLPCSVAPLTGFHRDGCCGTGPTDRGLHVVCADVTAAFLAFSASRWAEALAAGVAPPVLLEATDVAALSVLRLEDLRGHAVT